MSDDLVERVARAIYEAWCAFHGVTKTSMLWEDVWGEERQACIAEARAAIAVALEEAAKMLEERYAYGVANHQAAAIRALVKQSTTEEERA